jgi:serine O-acetyltransferase
MSFNLIFEYIKSDLYRYTTNISLKDFLIHYFFNNGFNISVWFRLSKTSTFFRYFFIFILKLKRNKFNIDLPYQAKIGYGLYIGHSGPLVISACANIGNNLNISQYVTIGAVNGIGPKIGNNVYIGPGAKIFGEITIADNCYIGANAVVNKSVLVPYSVIVGSPAYSVRIENQVWWQKNRLEMKL